MFKLSRWILSLCRFAEDNAVSSENEQSDILEKNQVNKSLYNNGKDKTVLEADKLIGEFNKITYNEFNIDMSYHFSYDHMKNSILIFKEKYPNAFQNLKNLSIKIYPYIQKIANDNYINNRYHATKSNNINLNQLKELIFFIKQENRDLVHQDSSYSINEIKRTILSNPIYYYQDILEYNLNYDSEFMFNMIQTLDPFNDPNKNVYYKFFNIAQEPFERYISNNLDKVLINLEFISKLRLSNDFIYNSIS